MTTKVLKSVSPFGKLCSNPSNNFSHRNTEPSRAPRTSNRTAWQQSLPSGLSGVLRTFCLWPRTKKSRQNFIHAFSQAKKISRMAVQQKQTGKRKNSCVCFCCTAIFADTQADKFFPLPSIVPKILSCLSRSAV